MPIRRNSSGRPRRFPAVSAEPAGPGIGRARDPLAREVRLLGAILGQVIAEQAGSELFALVERIRRRMIGLRRDDQGALVEADAERDATAGELAAVDLGHAAEVAKAFTVYFQLVNLAEERHRIRMLRSRAGRARGVPLDDSLGHAVGQLARTMEPEAVRRLVGRLEVHPVLTAHPTEARRRTLLQALRRIRRQLHFLDDPRVSPEEDAEARRRLREEITLLWHTADLRATAPTPLDEVRSALAVFDETLFSVVPRLQRTIDRAFDRTFPQAFDGPGDHPVATDTGMSGTRAPRVGAMLAFGSWIGADRDGHPGVSAEVTLAAARLHADHLLRGYEAVAQRLMQTVAARVPRERLDRGLGSALARDSEEVPEAMRLLQQRFPDEPFRQRFGAMAERLRRTRAALTDEPAPRSGGYARALAFDADLVVVQQALAGQGLGRVAWGEVADLRAQVATFGFHLASLEVRQHAAVHRAALAGLEAGVPLGGEAVAGVAIAEVLATFRVIARLQARLGEEACRRYVISFTTSPADVAVVLELARRAADPDLVVSAADGASSILGALPASLPQLDVVPLLESAAALAGAGPLLDALLGDPAYRAHLRSRSDRQEVMLGYSDSSKESGFLAANWLLYQAEEALVEVSRRHGVALTLFHGRGGAIGRGGGPAGRAILAQAPGSVDARLKFTEQGEVIAAHYADPAIAARHLDQVASAALLASTPEHEARVAAAARDGATTMADLAAISHAAYRSLVDHPDLGAFFSAATPIDLISGLGLGSRPSTRPGPSGAASSGLDLTALRAIPWVFAWSQSRANLPGWYGLGSALETFVARHGPAGMEDLASLYRRWPFFASVLDTAELSLAKADIATFRRYAELAEGPGCAAIRALIEAEFARSVRLLLLVTGRERLLAGHPTLSRSIALRNPYVYALSAVQLELLGRLRRPNLPAGEADAIRRVVGATINGVAAGLQNTG